MPRKIGIWGGSFDPVHVGHLILAQEAVARCGLDLLIWMPSGQPPHKDGPVASGDDRVRMVELAIDGEEAFEVSRIEVDGEGKSYTVGTLASVRDTRCAPGDRLCLLIGGDNAVDFAQWHRPEAVLDLAEVVVVDRPGFDRDTVPAPFADRMRFLDTPLLEISSTTVRERIRKGMRVRYWVPDAVLDWIGKRGLYG